jgi:protein TonB
MAKVEPRHEMLRWALAFVLALGAHLAVLTPLMAHRHTASDKETANAVLVDLSADAESAQAVLSDDRLPRDTQFSLPSDFKLAAPPEVQPLEETLSKETVQQPVEVEPQEKVREAGAEPQREAKAEPLHQEEPTPDIEPLRHENPPAVLPERVEPSKPKQEPTKPKAETKKEKPVTKPKLEAKKEKPVAKPKAEQPIQTAKLEETGKAAETSVAQKAASPAPSGGSAAGLADWSARLRAHLERHKRFPADADPQRDRGLARVSFVVDLQGRVLSQRLSGSSGSAALDREAVSLLQRAQPLPPPPREMGRNSVAVTVPINFQTH